MRAVVTVLGLLAGCNFPHGTLDQNGNDGPGDGPRPIDGSVDSRPLDAKVWMDAPPCADDDADGVCNNVDDWPCGPKPSAAANPVTMSGNNGATNTTVSNVNLDSTMRYAVVAPGDTISLTFRLQLSDTACPSACIDQLEAGWVDHATNTGNRFSQCLFDQTVQKNNPVDTNLSFSVGTPTTKKVYDLRVNLGQNTGCGDGGVNGWWGTAVPTDVKTIARLCVH